ncbi:MAG: DUF1059 domain-containing protein [Chloroflexi bacterium]|nr:DUF1059 domain-containing protein [Chloroflexota bacterium]
MVKKAKQFCSYECRDVGFDCDWRCSAPDEDTLIEKVAKHGAKVHKKKITAESKLKIKSLIKKTDKPYPEELECDITAKEEGREEDPGCAISG